MQRSTPRAVPIVVSAGLAVGVFCGLLFGFGTGASEAATGQSPTTSSSEIEAFVVPPPDSTGEARTAKSVAPPTAAATPTPAPTAVPSPAPAPTPAPASAPAPTMPVAPRIAKVTVDISPPAAASGARISIDGKQLDGASIEVPVDKKSVRLSISSAGFRPIDKKVELEGADTTIRQEMARRNTTVGSAKIRPTASPRPTIKPGIIDL